MIFLPIVECGLDFLKETRTISGQLFCRPFSLWGNDIVSLFSCEQPPKFIDDIRSVLDVVTQKLDSTISSTDVLGILIDNAGDFEAEVRDLEDGNSKLHFRKSKENAHYSRTFRSQMHGMD